MKALVTFTSIGHVLNTAAEILAKDFSEGNDIKYDFGRCRIMSNKKGEIVLKYRILGIFPYGGVLKGLPGEPAAQIRTLMAHGTNLNNGGLREMFRRSF